MPIALVTDPKPSGSNANSNQILWLALTLTPGLGPTRAKRLVEFFGGIEAVFNASLTELEAAGLPAAAAQSLGTAERLRSHPDIQEFYLGSKSGERRNYRDVKQYRRSRRWYG